MRVNWRQLLIISVRSAPPLSTWDAPEPRDHQHNRFARREVTKAARAAEYWASEADDYALPGQGSAPRSAFQTARTYAGGGERGDRDRMSQPVNVKREAKPPPVILPSRNHHFPELPKFTLGPADPIKKEADLGSWTSTSSSSLAMMKSLGLPGETPGAGSGGSSPLLGAMGSPRAGSTTTSPRGAAVGRLSGMTMPSRLTKPGVNGTTAAGTSGNITAGFQARAASSLDALKGIGLPEAAPAVQPSGNGAAGVADGTLARGKKRLGMGRPAPWGAKKARGE